MPASVGLYTPKLNCLGFGNKFAVAVLFLRTLKLRPDALGSDNYLACLELLFAMNWLLVLFIELLRCPIFLSFSFGISTSGRILLSSDGLSSLTAFGSVSGVIAFIGLEKFWPVMLIFGWSP